MAAAVERLKTPPHSIEAERLLLGALLLEPEAWARIANRIRTEDFYRQTHGKLYSAIARQAEVGDKLDVGIIVDSLERSNQLEACGGREYIAALMESTASAANVEAYADRVREYAVLRGLAHASQRIGQLAFEPGEKRAEELVGDAMTLLQGLNAQGRIGRGLVDSRELAHALLDDLDRRREGWRGISTGLPDFDQLTFGLEPGDLCILAGRPGMGKTALIVSIAAHVARDAGVAIFSAEMPALQLTRRCIALLASVSQGKLRRPEQLTDEEWDRIGDAACIFGERRICVDDRPSPTLAHIRAEAMARASRGDLGLVMVDYLQLVQGDGSQRYEQLRNVAYGLKDLAKELNIPVIALGQLNRSVEHRNDKRAGVSDLRDSGGIEEAADIIGLLYSEGYYDEEFGMGYVLECAIEKNRNGERGECLWHFTGEFSRVGTLEAGAREQYRRLRAKKRKPAEDDL